MGVALLRGFLVAIVVAAIFVGLYQAETLGSEIVVDEAIAFGAATLATWAFMIVLSMHREARPVIGPIVDAVTWASPFLGRVIVGASVGIAALVVVSIFNVAVCFAFQQRWPRSMFLQNNELYIAGPFWAVFLGGVAGAVLSVHSGYGHATMRTAILSAIAGLFTNIWLASVAVVIVTLLENQRLIWFTLEQAKIFAVVSGMVAGICGAILIRMRSL